MVRSRTAQEKRDSMLTRLFAICLLLIGFVSPGHAFGKTPANAPGPFKVLIIGNSHVFVNDVPSRLRQLLKASKGATQIRSITRGGAWLTGFTKRADVAATLRGGDWDVVVLQEATATFFTPRGRQTFHRSIDWFSAHIPAATRIVLYQTWPWRADSRYFAGRPLNAAKLWRDMQAAYAKAARRPRITVAPVGRCWMQSKRRSAFYSHDGNHASVAGSSLAARIIAATIAKPGEARC